MYLWLHDGRAAAGRAGDGLQQCGEHDLGDDQGRIIGGVVLERARLLRAGLVRRAGVVGARRVRRTPLAPLVSSQRRRASSWWNEKGW